MLRTALVTLAALFLSMPISATDLPAGGGRGGNAYRRSCPAGEYLVGLHGRTGDWVDSMQLVCARWNGNTLDAPHLTDTPIGDSKGGAPNDAYCPGAAAVVAVSPTFTNPEKSNFLDSIALRCVPVLTRQNDNSPAYLPRLRSTGETTRVGHGIFGLDVDPQICPTDELVVGFHGTAGLFIDSVGLICEAGPIPAPGNRQIGRAKGDPRFGSTHRVGGATDQSTAAITVEKSIGSSSVGGIRASNQLGSVAPPAPAGPATPAPSAGQHFTPPTFPDGSRLWACTNAGDESCEGGAATVAYCTSRGFRGLTQHSLPHLIDRGGMQVKNVRGQACMHRRCAVLDDVTCTH